MNIRRKLSAHAEVHTGPLNDILFILLMFFLIVSTLANPNIIKVNNPKGKSDSKAKQTVVISIDKQNNMFLGTKPFSEFMLDSVVKTEVEKLKLNIDTPSIVINADTLSLNGSFFKILGAAKKYGAKVVANTKP